MSSATTSPSSPPIFSKYPRTKNKRIKSTLDRDLRRELTDRQERLSWWNQSLMDQARICIVGAGGLGGPISLALVQMGAALTLVDFDLVEMSNRNRQLFMEKNEGMPKVHARLDNIFPYATGDVTLTGHWMRVQDFALREAWEQSFTAYCIGVDNDEANVAGAKLALEQETTAVFINVSRDGESCRVFIQRSGEACFACYKPEALAHRPAVGCPRTPAIADILLVAAGLAVRAVVGEIMGEPIGDYNCRDLALSGFDHAQRIERRPDCPLCGNAASGR